MSLTVLHFEKFNGMSFGTAPNIKSVRLTKSNPGANFFHSLPAGETIFDKIKLASALLVELRAAIFTIFSNTIFKDSVAKTPADPPFFLAFSFATNPYKS